MDSDDKDEFTIESNINNVKSVHEVINTRVISETSSKMDICRVCLVSTDTLKSIFHEYEISFADRLMLLAKVEIKPDDGLPSHICLECSDKLESAYNFKLQVERSDIVLRDKLCSFNNSEKEEFNSNIEITNNDFLQNYNMKRKIVVNKNNQEIQVEKCESLFTVPVNEHNYVQKQSENSENNEFIRDEENEKKEQESTRRSKRKLLQQKSAKNTSSDEDNYFENLNLSSRLKLQSEKMDKVFFMCYLCDKQFLSREILREHMYSHEEVKQILSLKIKTEEKEQRSRKTPEKLSLTKPTISSGKKSHVCSVCGKEYLYLISYKKHLQQHRKEKKASKKDSLPLKVSLKEVEDPLSLHEFDDGCTLDLESENEENEGEEKIIDTVVKINIDLPDIIQQDEEKCNDPVQKVESSQKQKCPLCPYTCQKQNTLDTHLKSHKDNCKINHEIEKVIDISCSECKKSFGNELTLRNHLIATGHKTTVKGEQYDLNKRIKRVAAKAALEVIDKIKTDLISDGEQNNDDDKDLDFEEIEEKYNIKSESGEYVMVDGKKISKNSKNITKRTDTQRDNENINFVKFERVEDEEDDDNYEGGIDDWPVTMYECTTCKKKYNTKKSLLRHQLLHEEPNFECDICNVKFYRKDKLKAHYDKCAEKNPNQVRKCNICNDVFESNEILREHRAKHVTEGILTEEDLMEIDPKPDRKNEDKTTTRKRRTDIVGLECTECNKNYTSRKGLLRHLQVHEGKKYLCDMCPKKFYRREHLKIHVAKHNIVKPFKCEKCPKRFLKEEMLKNHLLKHEPGVKKPRESTNSDGTKRFLCEICSKCFTQSTTLAAHLRAHQGIKPYVCEVCTRPFTTNAYLKMHMRTHTQERPYICQYCSRSFARADTLANHLTSHTGEAKYHCQFCPKRFRRLKSLKEHVFIHTGQKPYSCPTCDRKFNNNGSRYAHSKRCKQNQQQNNSQEEQIEQNNDLEEPSSSSQLLMVTTTGNSEEEEEDQQQIDEITQEGLVQRISTVNASTGQIFKPQNIKTITIARQVDNQQHVMAGQEILMPVILPFTVTLSDINDEVILPFTT